MHDALRTVRIRIEGRVQGVGFRAFVEREARSCRIDGFVRNRRDGGVEIVARGMLDDVDAFSKSCAKGPFGARVDMCKVIDDEAHVDDGFVVASTV
ncbi:MAG: acylphosphatase [Hyphomicrobiaceae bacterium]|nr:acylphosphatase [Hyphomicrobiaceae bacterium]